MRSGVICVSTLTNSAFDLPEHLAAKADPALIAGDEQHFSAISASLEASITDLSARLDAARREEGGGGQHAMDRDLEVHRLNARLQTLQRFGIDLCLGHVVGADDSEPVYIGRLGLNARDGRRLLVDWRSPAAEPFFGATHANPMGLSGRRRYRWTAGRITDYWDEMFTDGGLEGHAAALDDQSAFIASLGSSRSARMRDVLGTIQADQDAIIRAGSRGTLVVDGGPGTGKTVVALHRTAYLLYSDPRLGHDRGGVLFVGPHEQYLDYVSDVLPSLGEEGVLISTLRDLVPEGATVSDEADPEVVRLKAAAEMVTVIEPAVQLYEELPKQEMVVATQWSDLRLSPNDWAEAFSAPDPDLPHNLAREVIWQALLDILVDQHVDLDSETSPGLVRRELDRNRNLRLALDKAWTLVEPEDLVGDLWSVPAYLRRCAPWLDAAQVALLQRADPQAWTRADLPILDAARQRLGDSAAVRRERRRQDAIAATDAGMADVIGDLIASDDSEMQVMSMLRHQDLQYVLVDESVSSAVERDALAGPFAHVVVDEAQELTDAEWQMLLRRCPSRSFTVVGDRAQARHGFAESWEDRLRRVGMSKVGVATLSVNYRTPAEVMAEAEPVIRTALPDANVPTSIRTTGVPVEYGTVAGLRSLLDGWLDEHPDGVACVIGTGDLAGASVPNSPRIRCLSPELSKGLEFDLVVVIDPDTFGEGIEGAVDRYVAMTRATQRLVVLTT